MRKYYYQIVYQCFKYSPSKTMVYYGESIADAKLYAYSTLNAYNVSYVIRINKPL